MPRNRIIHNVQEVFIGSPDGERDDLVTGIPGHQILKRLNLVQSFDYSIGLEQDDISVMGKSAPIDEFVNKPTKIELSINYYLNGVNNEHRLGLNSANNSSPTDSWSHNIVHDIMHSSREKDKRNIYLIVNNDNRDPNEKTKGYPFLTPSTINDVVLKKDIIDPKSTGYGVVVFQNCYLTDYNVSTSISDIPLVSVSYASDNMIAYASGSGINIPDLDLKKGEIEEGDKEFIIPTHFKNIGLTDNEPDLCSDSQVEVLNSNNAEFSLDREGDEAGILTLHKETVQSCTISFSIDREPIEIFGHKMYKDRIPTFPVKASMNVDLIASGLLTGSLLVNKNENNYYDATIGFKNKSGETACKYKFSKARLLSANNTSSVNANKTVQLSFETYMNFDDNYFTSLDEDAPSNVELGAGQRGLFLSGKVVQLCAEIQHPESSINNKIHILDEDGNIMESVIGSPQF